MKHHYRKVRKKIRKIYLIRFEKYVLNRLTESIQAAFEKEYDKIHEEIMNGTESEQTIKGLLYYAK